MVSESVKIREVSTSLAQLQAINLVCYRLLYMRIVCMSVAIEQFTDRETFQLVIIIILKEVNPNSQTADRS